MDSSVPNEEVEEHIWNKNREQVVTDWKDDIVQDSLIYDTFLSKLKREEGVWSWIIILISTFTSSITLLQFEPTDYPYIDLIFRILVSVSSVTTTLIAAWIKKKNYSERIKSIDRHLQSLESLSTELSIALNVEPLFRPQYHEFLKSYRHRIMEACKRPTHIALEEFKHSTYVLIKYYPELMNNLSTNKKEQIIRSYQDYLYRGCFYQFCCSKCFRHKKCSKCCQDPPPSYIYSSARTPEESTGSSLACITEDPVESGE